MRIVCHCGFEFMYVEETDEWYCQCGNKVKVITNGKH